MDMETTTQMTLAWELYQEGVGKTRIAQHLGKDRETIRIWLHGIEQLGLSGFIDQHCQSKRSPRPRRQVPLETKKLVWSIREREMGCCGQKIAYFLDKEHGIKLSVPKIYEIIAQKYTLRSKGGKRHNQKRGPVPEATQPRQVVQMDTVHFGAVFAFTAVDICTREADVYLSSTLTAKAGALFLARCMPRRYNGYVELIQTDGGPEFKAEFIECAPTWCDCHRVARPYKKNEQSYIESFNRTLRSECLGWITYQPAEIASLVPCVEQFLERYHYHRPHLAFQPIRPPLLP